MSGQQGSAPGQHTPGERPDFILELPSDLRMIEAAVGYLADRLRAFSFRGSRLDLNFRVGLSEALANAVLYGNRGDPGKCVRIEVTLDEQQIALSVIDQGNGFDPCAVPDPTLPENIARPGGRGLFLLRELMDEVEYNDRGNAVRMVLRREPHSGRSTSAG